MFPRLRREHWPLYALTVASAVGWLFYEAAPAPVVRAILSERWSFAYWVVAPFMHGALWHLLMNALALNLLGGPMLSVLGAKRFLILFAAALVSANLANNFFGDNPAVGISGAVLGALACMTYPFGRAPMKFLVLHDILRLRPFPLWGIAAGIVLLDIAGIVFGWGTFAHWGHLGGFACGMVFGAFHFRRPPNVPPF